MDLIDKNKEISLNPDVAANVYATPNPPSVSPKTLYEKPVAQPAVVEISPEATFAEGLVAGARQTLAKALWDTLETPEFEVQPGYSPEQRYRHDIKTFGSQFSPDEQEYLLGAKSDEEYTHRLQVTVAKQQDLVTMGEAPVGALAGSVVDVDLFLGLGIGKVATTAAKAAKISNAVKLAALAKTLPNNPATKVVVTSLATNRAVVAAGGAAAGAAISGSLSASTTEATNRDTAMVVGDIIAGGVGGMFSGLSAVPKFVPKPLTSKGAGVAAEVDSKVGGGMTKLLSAYDRLASYIGKADADRILANPMDDVGDSAVTYARNAKLDGDRRLAEYEQVVQGIVGRGLTLNPRTRAAIRTQRLELEHDMMKLMNTNRQREIDGLPPLTSPNANVQAMADAYVKSGYAQEMLKKMKAAGVDGAEDIDASAFYMPVRHNYTKMAAAVQQGATSWESLRVMYGSQIAKMYPGLTDLGLTPSTIGGHFIETQKGSAAVGGIRGVLKEELRHMLVNAGVGKDKIENLLTDLYKKTEDAGKASNLRRRMDWNFDKVHIDGQGRSISMNDFLDTDVTSVMQRYNRTMSGRIGLAQAGFKSEAALKETLMRTRDDFAGSPEGIQGFDKFMEDINNSLLGRPTGEQMPDWLRAGNSVGAMMQLANSGLYNLVDYANIAHNFGIQSVAKHFIKSLRGSGISAVTVKEAETVQQVLTGRLVAEGRMRDVVTHLEDNFEAPVGGLYEAVSYAGQSTRFLNGSEYVRRHQINMVAGILDDLTTKLAAGDAQATEFFAKQNIPADRIAAIKAQVNKHGTVLEEWDDYATKEYFTTQMTSATDNIAVMVRNGEVPAMMAHSVVGKMLFPYMNFTFAMTQKLLRREYTRNGAVGVAALMVAQAPLATLSAALINISGGREWDDDLAVRATKALPIMGVGGVGFDAITRGELGGAAPIFGVFNQVGSAASSAAAGNLDAGTVLKTVPGASVFLPARMIVSLIDSEKE